MPNENKDKQAPTTTDTQLAAGPRPGSSVRDRKLAERCRQCPICSRARQKQRGAAYWLVKNVEAGLCPFCAAYERVYGRKAHEPDPRQAS